MSKKLIYVCIIAVLFITASFVILNYRQTGLITFFGQDLENRSAEENPAAVGENLVSNLAPSLSFSVVKPTELGVILTNDRLLPCPQYRELSFQIENLDKSDAERLFVRESENLNVIECRGCSVRTIAAKQKIEVTIKACKTDEQSAFISFSSINAEEKRIEIG